MQRSKTNYQDENKEEPSGVEDTGIYPSTNKVNKVICAPLWMIPEKEKNELRRQEKEVTAKAKTI